MLHAAANTAQAQYVTIPDANFAAFLAHKGFGACMHGNQLDTSCSAVKPAISVNGNVLVFNFPDIKLSDSAAGDSGRSGFAQFRIKSLLGPEPGTPISNTTSIYFDLNPPVSTNTVTNSLRSCVTTYANLYDTICAGQTFIFNNINLDTAGAYSDTLTNVGGCDSIVTLYLFVTPALTATFSYTSPVCAGGQLSDILYTGNATDEASFNWNFDGGLITSGNGPGPFEVFWDTAGDKNISLAVSQNGCYGADTNVVIVTAPLTFYDTAYICQGSAYVFEGDTLFTAADDTFSVLSATGGCDSLYYLSLHVLPNPDTPVITVNDSMLVSTFASSYLWYLNDTALSIFAAQTIVPQVNGIYQVQVTGANGCTSISAPYNETALALNSIGAGFYMKLYPNPNNGQFTIVFGDNISRTIQVTDALGRDILNAGKVNTQHHFDMDGFANGVYFMRVSWQDEVETLRFVIQK